MDNGLFEHELDHVYIGYSDEKPKIDHHEASDWKYMNIEESFRDSYNPSEHVNIVEEVLKINHQKGPMHYRDITESAINLGLLNKYGKIV